MELDLSTFLPIDQAFYSRRENHDGSAALWDDVVLDVVLLVHDGEP